MKSRKRAIILTCAIFAVPRTVLANGWSQVESCFSISLWITGLALVAALAFALRQRVSASGMFRRIIGTGLACGLGVLFLSMMAISPSEGPMMAIGLAIPVTLLATAGGVLLGLLGLAIRAVIRKSEMKTSQCDEPNPNAAVGHRKNMEGAALNTFGRPAAPDPTDEKK